MTLSFTQQLEFMREEANRVPTGSGHKPEYSPDYDTSSIKESDVKKKSKHILSEEVRGFGGFISEDHNDFILHGELVNAHTFSRYITDLEAKYLDACEELVGVKDENMVLQNKMSKILELCENADPMVGLVEYSIIEHIESILEEEL